MTTRLTVVVFAVPGDCLRKGLGCEGLRGFLEPDHPGGKVANDVAVLTENANGDVRRLGECEGDLVSGGGSCHVTFPQQFSRRGSD